MIPPEKLCERTENFVSGNAAFSLSQQLGGVG